MNGSASGEAAPSAYSPGKTRPSERSNHVLNGRLRLILGADDLTIEPGEAVEFTTWTPHWFGAVDGPVEVIMLVGPQGERLHLHA